jgi:hypothetical protein
LRDVSARGAGADVLPGADAVSGAVCAPRVEDTTRVAVVTKARRCVVMA